MESRITPPPRSPSTCKWPFIVATELLFTCQKNMTWLSRLGGTGRPRWKIPWQREDWGAKMVIERDPCMRKWRKIHCKDKRANKDHRKQNKSRYSHFNERNCLSQTNLGLSSCHVSVSAFPLQVLLICKHYTSHMQYYLFLLLRPPLPQQSRNRIWKVCFSWGNHQLITW